MRPCPHPPCPPPLPLPPHCWRGHGDSLTLLQIGLVLLNAGAAGAAGAAAAAGCTASTRSQSHKVTAGEGADSLTGLVWYGLPCTKLGANLSLSLPSSCFACPASLQPPFCCSALPSRPIRDIQDSPGLTRTHPPSPRRLGPPGCCLPSPRPFLNYTLHCARHLVGSCRQNITQPNPTQPTRTRTLLLPTSPSRPAAVHALRGTRDTLTCLLRLLRLRPPLSKFFFLLLSPPSPLSIFKLVSVSAASSLAASSTRPPTHCHTHSQPQNRR